MDVMQHTGNPLATPKNQRAAHPGVLLILVRGWGGCVCTCILLQRAQDTNREENRVVDVVIKSLLNKSMIV